MKTLLILFQTLLLQIVLNQSLACSSVPPPESQPRNPIEMKQNTPQELPKTTEESIREILPVAKFEYQLDSPQNDFVTTTTEASVSTQMGSSNTEEIVGQSGLGYIATQLNIQQTSLTTRGQNGSSNVEIVSSLSKTVNDCSMFCAVPNCFMNYMFYKENNCRRLVNSFYPNLGLPIFSKPDIQSQVVKFVDCKPILVFNEKIRGGIYNNTIIDFLPEFAPQLKRKWFIRQELRKTLQNWYRVAQDRIEGFISETLLSSFYALNLLCPENIRDGCRNLGESQIWKIRINGVGQGCRRQ